MTFTMRSALAGVTGVLLLGGVALAQQPSPKPGCDPAKTPQSFEGKVIKIDPAQQRVTVQAANGSTHEFQASREALQDLKVGDSLQARLRSNPSC
jgi:hypothetical protein